jgi:hypothetical protein
MAVRILVMFSVMILELALGIAGLLGVSSMYPHRMDESGIAGCVMIVAGILVAWLITLALFVRKSSRARAGRMIDDAKSQAAKILADATDKALALCSLDAGKCRQCGNPRTGKFCPKCGAVGESAGADPAPSHPARAG